MGVKQLGENAAFWGRWAPTYDQTSSNERYDALARRIAEDIGTVDSVLDIATGTGLVAFELAKNVRLVQAVDMSPEMIAVAEHKASERHVNNIRFSVQGAYELDFPSHVFDAVVILNALHTMQRPEQALAEARRVLKPDGLLIVPTPCHGQTEQTREQLRRMAEAGFGFKDYQQFTSDSLYQLVLSCGFMEIERETIQWVFEETRFRMIVEYLAVRPT
jgi:phosphatidylethanolamine/phosphatidyl-N-methylethanolamine N-methyltransferase